MSEKKSFRVIIAEDDFMVTNAIKHILSDIGYETIGTAITGEEAFELTRTLRPDVVLMDIQMPVMDGIKATQKIQEQCPTPVIIVTAYLTKELVNTASENGVSAYLVKPPDPDELERTIKIAIARHGDMMKLKRLNEELKYENKLRNSLYKISDAASNAENIEQLYKIIHKIICELIHAKNLYIALYHSDKNVISYPYFIDEYDETPKTTKPGKRITIKVLKTGKPLLVKKPEFKKLEDEGEIEIWGSLPYCWLGVPLKIQNNIIGVIAVQSYEENIEYGDKEKDVLIFVSEQIAMAIDHVRNDEELKRAHIQMRNLTARLQELREEEKVKMTYGVREDFGQILSVLKMDLSWLDKKFGNKKSNESEKIKSMIELIESTGKDVQKVTSELRPSYLDHIGLNPTIKWYAEEFQNKTGIKCKTLFEPNELELSKNLSITLYRILEEVLDNIKKHADASTVKISVKLKDKKLVMNITDDGIGIPEEKINDPKSVGLIGIRERILPFGGNVIIRGFQSKGTKVIVNIPMKNAVNYLG